MQALVLKCNKLENINLNLKYEKSLLANNRVQSTEDTFLNQIISTTNDYLKN